MSNARVNLQSALTGARMDDAGRVEVSRFELADVLESPITVHVAAVEYGDEVETTLHAAADLPTLHREIRTSIESEVLDMLVAEWRPEVYEYVARRRGDGSEWADWHGELHEIDGTPWVTIEEKEI